MAEEIDISLLFLLMSPIIERCDTFPGSCSCQGCDYMIRSTIYFNLLKSNLNNDNYKRICEIIVNKEDVDFTFNFIYSFLIKIDEESSLESIYDFKDNLNDVQYLDCCNGLLSVKRFKKMMKQIS